MINLVIKNLSQNAVYALVAAVTIVSMMFMGFFMAEPVVSRAQVDTSTPFTISQSITGENSFTVEPGDITMVGSIAGLTGGNATGSAGFVVTSNNSSGYYVDIAFDNNAGDHSMRGETTGSESIRDYYDNYGAASTTYNWISSTSAQFGYTITSSTTLDTSDNFLDDGAGFCGTGATNNNDGKCWRAATSSAFEIVNRDTAAPSGASTTITFKVNVPSGAVPTPVTDTYTATATLSLYLQ